MIWNKFLSYSFHLFFLAASINSGSALVNVNTCGDLSIEEPAILGRNVTFTFTPSFYDEKASILWQRTDKRNPWSTLMMKPKFDQFVKDGTYYFIVTDAVSTMTKNDAMFYRIQYFNDSVKCTMETPILKLKALVNVNTCGDLSIEEPAILGRNVTFTFTPSFYDEKASILWQRSNKVNPWSTFQGKPKFDQFVKDGTYYLILTDTVSTMTKNDAIFYRIQYFNDSVKCTMETPRLELKDISREPCGYVHLRTKKIEFGKKVEIEYFPNKTVTDYPHRYTRVWVHSYNQRTVNISRMDGVYEERAMDNDKYVFTIFSFDENMNGRYEVRCDAMHYSNAVKVILPVPPIPPSFERLTNIEDCQNCIVCTEGDWCRICCRISGGTEPITVTMAIENERKTPSFDQTAGCYAAYFIFRNNQHMGLVNCSVKNDLLISPLTTTATIFVIKPPTFLRLGSEIPEVLREGDPVNITCKFATGRPTPTLSLKIFGTALSPVQRTDTFSTTDQSYSSAISLTTFKRIWNGQNISCCRYSNLYNPKDKCVVLGSVNYLFPPSDLKLQIITKERPTQIEAVCTIYGSNPACQAKWQAPDGSIHSERNIKKTSRPSGAWDSVYRVTVNTSQNYIGKQITCLSDCPDFNVSVKKSESLPYKPTIEFNISSSVLEIFKGDQATVKCTARSIPKSDIFWVDPRTSDEEPIILRECLHETDCVISIRGDNITQRILFCSTIHLLESNSRKLTIHIIEKRSKHAKDQEGMAGAGYFISWVLLAFIVGTAIVIIIVVLVKGKKLNDANATSAAKHSSGEDTVRHRCNDEPDEPLHGNMKDNMQVSGRPTPKHDEGDTEAIDATPSDDKDVIQASGQPPGSKPLQETVVNLRDSPTEYVSGVLVKTAGQVYGRRKVH